MKSKRDVLSFTYSSVKEKDKDIINRKFKNRNPWNIKLTTTD